MRSVYWLLGIVVSGFGCGHDEQAAEPPGAMHARPVIVSEAGRSAVEAVPQPSAAGITLGDRVNTAPCPAIGIPGCPSGARIVSNPEITAEQAREVIFTVCHNDDCFDGQMGDRLWFAAPPDFDTHPSPKGYVEVALVAASPARYGVFDLEQAWQIDPAKLNDGDRFRTKVTFPDGRQLRLVDTAVTYVGVASPPQPPRYCGGTCRSALLDLRGQPPIDTLKDPPPHSDDAGAEDASS